MSAQQALGRSKLVIALLLGGAALVVLVVWLRPSGGGSGSQVPAPAPVHVPAANDAKKEAAIEAPPLEVEREAVARDAAQPAAAATAPAQPSEASKLVAGGKNLLFHGYVLDMRGQGVANVGLRFEPPLPDKILAWSGADGAFQLSIDRSAGQIVAAGDQHATVRAGALRVEGQNADCIVVVAPAIDIEGNVVDDAGKGLVCRNVRLETPMRLFAGFPRALDASNDVWRSVVSDANGRFAFQRVPAVEGAQLTASVEAHEPAAVNAPLASTSDVRLVLTRLDDRHAAVTGSVVEADGRPVAEAGVRLNTLATKTDVDGRFRLFLESWVPNDAPLVAFKSGYRAAVVPDFGQLVAQDKDNVPAQRLMLGGAALKIAGKLLDGDGGPCAGWEIRLLDATIITPGRIPADSAEAMSSWSNNRPRTDAAGQFELDGLSERDYRIQCWNAKTLQRIESDPIAAGRTDVVLRLPKDNVWKKLRGEVRAPDGTPIENVRVSTTLVIDRNSGAVGYTTGASTVTNALGAFELDDVPRKWIDLQLDGPAILPLTTTLADVNPEQLLVISVRRRAHFRIENAGKETSGVQLETPAGDPVQIWSIQANTRSSSSRTLLQDGASHVLSVGEGEYVLILFRGNEEAGRSTIKLVAGEVTVVRL